jgi:hypothetical protein
MRLCLVWLPAQLLTTKITFRVDPPRFFDATDYGLRPAQPVAAPWALVSHPTFLRHFVFKLGLAGILTILPLCQFL